MELTFFDTYTYHIWVYTYIYIYINMYVSLEISATLNINGANTCISYTRVYETSAGELRSIYPSLGMRQLFGDVTMGPWRHSQPT